MGLVVLFVLVIIVFFLVVSHSSKSSTGGTLNYNHNLTLEENYNPPKPTEERLWHELNYPKYHCTIHNIPPVTGNYYSQRYFGDDDEYTYYVCENIGTTTCNNCVNREIRRTTDYDVLIGFDSGCKRKEVNTWQKPKPVLKNKKEELDFLEPHTEEERKYQEIVREIKRREQERERDRIRKEQGLPEYDAEEHLNDNMTPEEKMKKAIEIVKNRENLKNDSL